MLLRRFTDFVLQSRWQAILAAFVIGFIPVIGSIGILIAAFVTLRKGVFEGALVALATTLPTLISYVTYQPATDVTFATVAVIVLVASNFLSWFFATILRRFESWNLVLESAAYLGILGVVIVHVAYPNIFEWWEVQLADYLHKTSAMVNPNPDAEVTAAQAQVASVMKFYATGFVAASVLFNALIQVLLARWWQALMFNPGGLRKELHQIRLSHFSAGIFVVAVVLYYWGIGFVSDIMPVLFLTFCAAGLSLLHYLVAPSKLSWLWLTIIYLVIIWLFPVSVIIVSVVAFADSMFNFRQKFNRV